MNIFFHTKKLEKLCSNQNEAIRKLGKNNATLLQKRLLRLLAVQYLSDFAYGSPHPLKGNKKDQFAIGLDSGCRLVFKALEPIPKTEDDAIDWKKVESIKIIFIGDYHE